MRDSLDIRFTTSMEDREWSAQLMAESEPWITLRRTMDQCRVSVGRPDAELYLARLGGERIGFLVLRMTGAFVGYVQTICIDPAHQGMGLGTEFISFAEERIFLESPNVFMCVSSFNPRAKALYGRLGYEEVGALTNYIVHGHDEILLRKTRGPLSTFTPVGPR